MPTYVYRCKSGHEFELRQGFDASAEEVCPVCNTPARRRIYSPAVIYKGSGFYTTDYARKNVVPAGEAKDVAKNAKDKGGEASSSSKEGGEGKESSGGSNNHDAGHGHDHGHSHDTQEGIVTPAS